MKEGNRQAHYEGCCRPLVTNLVTNHLCRLQIMPLCVVVFFNFALVICAWLQ